MLPRLDDLRRVSDLERRDFEGAERLVEVRREALQALDRHAEGMDAAKAVDAEGKAGAIKALHDAVQQMNVARKKVDATSDRIVEIVSLKESLCARLADDVLALRNIDEQQRAVLQAVAHARDRGISARTVMMTTLKDLSGEDAPQQHVAGSEITSEEG